MNELNNRQYKLIAFDVDGTILNAEDEVCYRLRDLVKQLLKLDYSFTLVTARLPNSALYIAKQLGLDSKQAIVTLNGGFITDASRNILFQQSFASDKLNDSLYQLDPRIAINYYHGFQWGIVRPNSYFEYEMEHYAVAEATEGSLEQVNKISLMGDAKLLQQARYFLQERFSDLSLAFSSPNYLELSSKNISKFTGLAQYAKMNQIAMSEIIAFGDGENDIPMLDGVGLGVAMANASDEVKRIADDVALHHADSGVAIYLERLLATKILY